MAEHVNCAGSTFQTRVQFDGRTLLRCTKCGRVARTVRVHRLPDSSTRSHDKTMAILWDGAKEIA